MKIFEFQFVFDWFFSNDTKWLRAALEMKASYIETPMRQKHHVWVFVVYETVLLIHKDT